MMSDIRKEMWKTMADSPFIMIGLDSSDGHREPMTAQLDEEANNAFWIYTTVDNRIARGGAATAQYMSKGHDLFACIHGTLTPEVDSTMIDHFWSRQVAAWYSGGRNDRKLRMLRFDLKDAEVWTIDPGLMGKFKLLTGMKVDPDKMGDHAELKL